MAGFETHSCKSNTVAESSAREKVEQCRERESAGQESDFSQGVALARYWQKAFQSLTS